MITREILETRIQEMTAARTKLQSDVDANTGAIQLCHHLLAKIEAEEIVAEAKDALVAKAEAIPEPAPKPNGEAAGP